jgi:hypothetical protein
LKNKVHIKINSCLTIKNEILSKWNVLLFLKHVKCFKLKDFISNLKYTRSWSGIRTAIDGCLSAEWVTFNSDNNSIYFLFIYVQFRQFNIQLNQHQYTKNTIHVYIQNWIQKQWNITQPTNQGGQFKTST